MSSYLRIGVYTGIDLTYFGLLRRTYSDAPFQPRQPGYGASRLFTNEQSRQLLEYEFLAAGRKIHNFANEPNPMLKPLGFLPLQSRFRFAVRNLPKLPQQLSTCPLVWESGVST